MSFEKVKILIDADVLIHFFKAERITLLNQLYNGRLAMLDIVLNELRSNRTINAQLDSIFLFSGIEEIEFPTTSNKHLLNEYVSLGGRINGKGERATLIFCKHYKQIIASSNTSDIIPFCDENGIAYLTTLDILCVAEYKRLITEKEADALIRKILSKGSFLCCQTIKQHKVEHFDSAKLLY